MKILNWLATAYERWQIRRAFDREFRVYEAQIAEWAREG